MVKTLGERIRELREAKDLSLRELAKKLELSAAFLSDIELGRRNPSDEVLTRMVRVLGTTADDLRTHDTRPPVEEIRRLAASDPAYGLAFRRVIDEGLSPQEIISFLERKKAGAKKKE
jgi:transcriptional regulator with XRE-family HTH domain